MCDSAFIGRAGVDMIGMTSWRCMECGFFWWLTPTPVDERAPVNRLPASITRLDSVPASRTSAAVSRAA
jgi:hypothetical protein